MMFATSIRLAAALALAGTAGLAKPPPSAGGLFPTDGASRASGAMAIVRVGPAAKDVLRISPVTFLSRPGTNPGEGSKSMCGLVIAAPGRRSEGVVTVGSGPTEATPSCDAIVAVGAVPPAAGERVRRIGVIHAVSSRNAADGRTAVVLRRNGAGMWSIDEGATARADTITRYTIAELRQKLH